MITRSKDEPNFPCLMNAILSLVELDPTRFHCSMPFNLAPSAEISHDWERTDELLVSVNRRRHRSSFALLSSTRRCWWRSKRWTRCCVASLWRPWRTWTSSWRARWPITCSKRATCPSPASIWRRWTSSAAAIMACDPTTSTVPRATSNALSPSRTCHAKSRPPSSPASSRLVLHPPLTRADTVFRT